MILYRVDAEAEKMRLDVFLAEKNDLTRSRAEKLIREGCVRVDG